MPTRLEPYNPTFGNPPFDDASQRVLILRLSPYVDVDRSASHLFLASSARRAEPESFVDFAFLPPRQTCDRLSKAGLPLLYGIESGRPSGDFDIVLVSNSFVLELLNLPYLLHQSGIPIWSPDRDGRYPPIVLGGSNAFASQGLARPDGTGVPDAIFFGEGEGHLERFLKAWCGDKTGVKRDRLERASEGVDGFWVTGRWPDRPIRQAVARDGLASPPAVYPILGGATAGTVRLQAGYGCPAFCAFCFEGYERKPYREIGVEALVAQAAALKAAGGAREVEVDAFNLNTHSGTAELLLRLARMFERVSFMSQRVDIMADEPRLSALEFACGKRSFTLGIEGISERMRAFLNKSLDGESVQAVLYDLLGRRARELKLFYVLTGHEGDADIAEFGAFCGRLAAPARLSGTRIIFSFGLLVRMPNTPLRYDRLFLQRGHWDMLTGHVRRACESHGFEFRLSSSWPEYAAGQSLAAGGHEMAETVADLAVRGVCYDGHLQAGAADRLSRALPESALDEKPAEARFPFDFVDRAVASSFLFRQYLRAKSMRDSGYCLGEKCLRCGACVSADERVAIVDRSRAPAVERDQVEALDALTREKARLPTVYFAARLPDAFGGTGPEWASAGLMRMLLTGHPELTETLLSVEDAVFGSSQLSERFPVMAGETVLAVRGWDAGRLTSALSGASVELKGWGTLALGSALGPFAPGRFSAAVIEMRVDADVADVSDSLCRWLSAAKHAFTSRRDGPCWILDVAQARQKSGLLAGRIEPCGGSAKVTLTVSPRFDARGWVGSSDRVALVVCRSVTF